MMLLGNALQPNSTKITKIITEIVDIKDGLIRAVRKLKKSYCYLQKIFKDFQKILLSGGDTIH